MAKQRDVLRALRDVHQAAWYQANTSQCLTVVGKGQVVLRAAGNEAVDTGRQALACELFKLLDVERVAKAHWCTLVLRTAVLFALGAARRLMVQARSRG